MSAKTEAEKRRKWRAENREHYRAYKREYRIKNRSKLVAQERDRRAKHPVRYQEYHLRAQYGLTVERFDQMKLRQAGRCAACRCLPKKLHVDHCHETGAIRGLLCGNCNRALGLLKEDPLRIRALAAYAEMFDWLK